MTSEATLHMFAYDNTDFVIATDAEDAKGAYEKSMGDMDDPAAEWEQIDDATPFKMALDDPPVDCSFPSNEGWTKDEKRKLWVSERTCGEWAKLAGRGYLASTEW